MNLLKTICLLLLLIPNTIYGQNPLRLVLELSDEYQSVQVELLKDSSLLVFYPAQSLSGTSSRDEWCFRQYNVHFEMINESYTYLPGGLNKYQIKQEGKQLWLLFSSSGMLAEEKAALVAYELNEKTINTRVFDLPKKSDVADFVISQSDCYILINTKNSASLARLPEKKDKIQIKEFAIKKGDIMGSNISIANKEALSVRCIIYPDNKKSLIREYIIDKEGFEQESKEIALDLVVTGLTETSIKNLYVGFSNDRKDKDEFGHLFANGIFSLKQSTVKTLSFEKMSGAAALQEKKAKTDLMQFIIHRNPIIYNEGISIISMEAFSPEYRTESRMAYDFYGRMMPSNYSVFEGYRHQATFIAALDDQGDFLWWGSFHFKNIVLETPASVAQIIPIDNEYLLAFIKDGNIITYPLLNGKITGDADLSPIELNTPSERLRSDKNCQIKKWYGSYYLVFGYQNIRESHARNLKDKNIFFLNKLEVLP